MNRFTNKEFLIKRLNYSLVNWKKYQVKPDKKPKIVHISNSLRFIYRLGVMPFYFDWKNEDLKRDIPYRKS